jgi:hypothetical protein
MGFESPLSKNLKLNKMKIKKTTGQWKGGRLIIRTFKYADDGHRFLNKQDNNDWQVYEGELKSGTYAYAGGAWHNVKGLDSSVLAHI